MEHKNWIKKWKTWIMQKLNLCNIMDNKKLLSFVLQTSTQCKEGTTHYYHSIFEVMDRNDDWKLYPLLGADRIV